MSLVAPELRSANRRAMVASDPANVSIVASNIARIVLRRRRLAVPRNGLAVLKIDFGAAAGIELGLFSEDHLCAARTELKTAAR